MSTAAGRPRIRSCTFPGSRRGRRVTDDGSGVPNEGPPIQGAVDMTVRAATDREPKPVTPTSLAGARAGDELRVEDIVLELVRTRCFDVGIAVGDRLRVRGRSGREVVARTADGRTVRLPQPYAFFVRVSYRGPADQPREPYKENGAVL